MHDIDPDNHFYNNTPTNSKCYSDKQFVCNVKSESDLSFIHFNARSLNKYFLLRISLITLSYCLIL